MYCVAPLRDDKREIFTKLFKAYYAELGCEDDACGLVEDCVLPDLLAGLIKADVICEGEICVGFVIYQKDDIDNEWNFKEGWGDIREIYIVPAMRGKGLGRFLLYTAEMKLKESGVTKAYALPSESAEGFFAGCGYKKTTDYCSELDCPVYEKTDLNNCGCKVK